MMVYGLIDSRTNALVYVGKTGDSAAVRLHVHMQDAKTKPNRRSRWLRSLVKLGFRPELVELETVEGDGNDAERFWIASLRAAGALLLNGTDGGDGVPSAAWTPEMRAKIAAANRKRRHPQEVRAKIGAAHRGMKRGEATKQAMRAAWTPERRAEMSARMRKATP